MMRCGERVRTTLALALASGVWSFSAVSLAQAPPAPDKETIQQVLGLLKAANASYDAGRYEEALQGYEQAYGLYPDPKMLYRMGQTNERLGRKREAVRSYEEFVSKMPANDANAITVAAQLPALKAEVKPLVRVSSTPSGANIYVGGLDRAPVGSTPYEAELEPGPTVFVVRRDGYAPARREVVLEPAGEVTLEVTLTPMGEAASAAANKASSGQDGLASKGTLTTGGWVLTGVGGALLITGGVFSLLQSQATDDVNSYNKRQPGRAPATMRAEVQDLKDTASSRHRAALTTYIAGGVIAAAGVGLLLYANGLPEEGDGPSAGVTWQWGVADGGGWLGLSGQF